MAQYILQFYNETSADADKKPGRLIKNFTVSEENPIPAAVESIRDQMIIEDQELYDNIVAAYNNYAGDPSELRYEYDTETGEVTWK